MSSLKMPQENEYQPPELPEGVIPFEDSYSDKNEKIAQDRKAQIEEWREAYEKALAEPELLPDGQKNIDYLDPREVIINAADKNSLKTLQGFKQLIADYRLVVIGALNASVSAVDRAKLLEENRFLSGIEHGIIKKLEERVENLEAKEKEAKIKAFYEDPINKEFTDLDALAKKKDSLKEKNLSVDQLRKAITEVHLLLTLVERDKHKAIPELVPEVKQNSEAVLDLYTHFTDQLLVKLQDRTVLEQVGNAPVRDKTKALFSKLDKNLEELSKKEGQAVLNAAQELKTSLKAYLAMSFDELVAAISVKGTDAFGTEVTLFPTEVQKKKLEQFITTTFNEKIKQFEKNFAENLDKNIEKTVNKINSITNDRLALKAGDPQRVYYTAVLALAEELRAVTTEVPLGFQAQQELLGFAKKKVDALILEFEFRHPEYLTDDELLKLVIEKKVVPYDYSNWRLTTLNDQKLPLRNRWFEVTESFDESSAGSDLKRARLKIQYVIAEYTQRLISGKQLAEINEDEVLPSLKNALSTRLELIKGLQLAEAGLNKLGASVREMMWYIAKNTARKDTEINSSELAYDKLSDLPDGSREAAIRNLRRNFPDKDGYTEENRVLAVDSAILFKYLTSALLELMRFTQTGAHEYEKNVDILLVENIFKYAIHVIQRYGDVEHAWAELFMFLVEVPEDWGASDAKMEATLHTTELIKSYLKCFGDVSGFVEKIQSPRFMVPMFPNMLQLTGLRPDETIHADGKVYGYGMTHFADVREFVVREVNGKQVEVPIRFEKDQDRKDFNFDAMMATPLMLVKNYDTGEVVGRKKLSRVMNGSQEVPGSFVEEKEGDFEERGVFFQPDSGGPLLRVLPIEADSSYGVSGYLVGNFKLVDKVDSKNISYKEWEVDSASHYFVVENLQKPKYFIYDNPKNKTGAKEVDALVYEDEYGVWLYDKEGKPIGTFKNGKIWRSTNARNNIGAAIEIGYQVNAYTDNDGAEIQTVKKYSLANSGQELGSSGEAIYLNRKIAYVPQHQNVFGASKVVIDKYGVYVEEEELQDLFIKYGNAHQRHEREELIKKGTVPKLMKRKQVGYVDISQIYAMDNDGRMMGQTDTATGRVFRGGLAIGKLNNDGVVIDLKTGEAIGFGTYAVRLFDDHKTHIGFIYPEVTDSKGNVIDGIAPSLKAAGIDDDRKLPLDGFVNTFEKEEVARDAYQRLWKELLKEMDMIDAHNLLRSQGSKRSEFINFFADMLGKIKMQDGPHMHMYGALVKYMIFNRMQKIALHIKPGRSREQQRKSKLSEMRGLWFEIYETLERMYSDSGLSGAYKFMLLDVLQWMRDDTNKGKGQEGMNPSLTNLYWQTKPGEQARIEYLDKMWQKESTKRPNPHAYDKKLGRIPGVGEGFGLNGYATDGNFLAVNKMRGVATAARVDGNIDLANSLELYIEQFQLEDISQLESPYTKQSADAVNQSMKEKK